MTETGRVSGRVIAAARSLTGVSQASFAEAAGISVETVRLLEASGSAWITSPQHIEAALRGFEYFGVMVIDESDGMGAGVRLKFSRQDVKQIDRLESEGGVVASDDAR